MELSIEPDAAETLAEDAEDPEMEEMFREIADSDEVFSTDVSRDSVENMVDTIVTNEYVELLQDHEDELTEELTRYDAGRFRGVIETVKLFNMYDREDITEEQVNDLFPESVLQMAEEGGLDR